MRTAGRRADRDIRVYFTGGATAVLFGWRPTTVDIDLKVVPESDALFRALPELKEQLSINLELASPADFVPELLGWESRSPFIRKEGNASFHHYDLYAQALAKIERGHNQDLEDVREMLKRGLVEASRLLWFFEQIEPRLYLYPAIDPPSFRRAVENVAASGVLRPSHP